MTNYQMIIQINDKTRANIEKIQENNKMEKINKCISFTEDLNLWLSCCGEFQDYILVREAQDECIKSILMCMQEFYKEAMMSLRQAMEHMLFVIFLSTSDGDTFEPVHDALQITLIRNINDDNYVSNMKEMVMRQVKDSALATRLSKNGANFTLLAYAASGNPRYLLKSVKLANKMDSNSINEVFREYYREDLWAEHTKLGERYPGYQRFIDWGRDFIETKAIPEIKMMDFYKKKREQHFIFGLIKMHLRRLNNLYEFLSILD